MDIYQEAYKELDKRRTQNQQLKENRTQAVYQAIPRIKQIDQTISTLGIELTAAALSGTEDLADQLESLKRHINTLNQEKATLLSEKHSPNYLNLHYFCQTCQDHGHVHNKRCTCVQKLVTDKYLELSGTQAVLDRENFDSFDLNFYDDQNQLAGTTLTERTYMQAIYNQVKYFCEHFGKVYDNLLFFGEPGRGKTFLCNCIAKALTDAGHGVFYTTAVRLSKTIEASRFDKDQQAKKMIDIYYSAPLLILDDLGTEFSTTVTDPELFSIINTRIMTQKSTIISTNLDSKSIEAMYSARIASRLFGEYKPYKIIGSDIRLAKRRKKQ